MKSFIKVALAVSLLVSSIAVFARQIVVSVNGPSDYRSIQAAVDSVPADNRERVIIRIRNGTYTEQIRIHNSFITLFGEDTKKTRIVANVDTSACEVAPTESKEEHCAVVIANGVDLVFKNLSIENLAKVPQGKGAALSLVNDSTRILLHKVDVIGQGGDTLTLSARRNRRGDGAEYYLNDVYVSGTYHIIVPRGATYVANSSFWCMGGERNCLFAEGITRETDKLVIKDSVIDGPEPFGLGSYFRDAAWYFINDTFSSKLKPDGFIHREPAKDYKLKWGEGRVYFSSAKGPSYPWLKDNISTSGVSVASLSADSVFPSWKPERKDRPRIKYIACRGRELDLVFSEPVTVEGKIFVVFSSGEKLPYLRGSGTEVVVFASRAGSPTHLDLSSGSIFASAATLDRRDAEIAFEGKPCQD